MGNIVSKKLFLKFLFNFDFLNIFLLFNFENKDHSCIHFVLSDTRDFCLSYFPPQLNFTLLLLLMPFYSCLLSTMKKKKKIAI